MLIASTWSSLKRILDQQRPAQTWDGGATRGDVLRQLAESGLTRLPLPGGGRTLDRWRCLAQVAAHDLSLVKLYEGHTDALAILEEALHDAPSDSVIWGTWAAEAPGARVTFERTSDGRLTLTGRKAWCSGARLVDRGLLTVWRPDGLGPFLAEVDMRQAAISFDATQWQAVGMAATDSQDILFDRAVATLVGPERFYLTRRGFWQGGAGIAACWHGATCAIAEALREQSRSARDPAWHRLLALGEIDRTLSANAALLREAAAWIDAHPAGDARLVALRTRAATEAAADVVLQAATRAMGATPLCRNAAFARRAADLPVFVRQSHGDRDLVALGEQVLDSEETGWSL